MAMVTTRSMIRSCGTSPASSTQADLEDDQFDAPEAAGLDATLRGLSLVCTDTETLQVGGHLFDSPYELRRRTLLRGQG